MFFIITMYSATIPILYFTGFLVCIVQYWVDKALYLRDYKNPPKYGLELAKYCRLAIEYALVVHLFMGLYMMSNPDIFPPGDDENEIILKLQ